jgi:hypothetical protein
MNKKEISDIRHNLNNALCIIKLQCACLSRTNNSDAGLSGWIEEIEHQVKVAADYLTCLENPIMYRLLRLDLKTNQVQVVLENSDEKKISDFILVMSEKCLEKFFVETSNDTEIIGAKEFLKINS